MGKKHERTRNKSVEKEGNKYLEGTNEFCNDQGKS